MKRFLIVILLAYSIASQAQDDSTKYIHYRYQYGNRVARVMADSVFHLPFVDTIFHPSKPGALTMRPQDSLVYQWGGIKWGLFGIGGGTTLSGTGYVKMSGSTPSYNATIPNADLTNSTISIAGNSTALGGSVTQDQITGLSGTGLIKRTGANTLAIATAGTDYISSESDPLAAKKANNLSDLSNTATARTNLGATTVGGNFFTLTNPAAITFPRINADNSVSALDAATFRTAIGAGTGTVTTFSASAPSWLTTSVSNSTSTPSLSITATTGLSANQILATPDGTTGAVALRSLTANDIPSLAESKITNLTTDLAAKQATLVSGTNIKTVNGNSLLGAGDVSITASVTDGNKGDVTVASSGASWTINNGSVTLAKTTGIEASFTTTTEDFTGSTSLSITVAHTIKSGKAVVVWYNGLPLDNTAFTATAGGTTVTLSGLTRETTDKIKIEYPY